MNAELRDQLVDIAMGPDPEYQRKRLELVSAEQAVTEMRRQRKHYELQERIAEQRLRSIRNEFETRYGPWL